MQNLSRNSSLIAEAEYVLNDQIPQTERGVAASATMAVVNHDLSLAKQLVDSLIVTPTGRETLVSELQQLNREGWYRSLVDLFKMIPMDAFAEFTSEISCLVSSAHSGMQKLGVNEISSRFVEAVAGTRFQSDLNPEHVDIADQQESDKIVHTLRDLQGSPELAHVLTNLPVTVSELAFNDYIERERYTWGVELLDICYVNGSHRAKLIEIGAVQKMAQALVETSSVVTLRFLAQIVKGRPEYKSDFCSALRIRER
ncbi:MAG: hypothetical protein KDD62_00815 [Bdellovibrionales bacterium]|nr:hypothetical protein [Bdellovibrionales bacterium]